MKQYQNISIPTKQLRDLRKALGRGGYKKIAEKLDCTPDWVGQVLRDGELAATHVSIVETAVNFVEERNALAAALTQRIKEAVK